MSYRNPLSTATAIDTGRGQQGVPSFRAYQDVSNPSVPRGIAEWATGLMDRNAQLYLSGGSGNSAFVLDGGATAGVNAPQLALVVQDAATSGKEAVARFTRAARLEVPKLTDYSGNDLYNGGTSAAIFGATPPAGTKLTTKIFSATVAGNASGDATITYPGGAFLNGLVGITVASYPPNATAPGGYFWDPYRPASLASLNVRCFLGSTVVASPSLGLTVVAVGW